MEVQMIQAIRVHQYGGPEQLKLEQIPCQEKRGTSYQQSLANDRSVD
jgi:hypothetical protein